MAKSNITTSDGGRVVAMIRDSDGVERYGVLRRIITLNKGYTDAQLKDFENIIQQSLSKPKQKFQVEAIGIDEITAGVSFWLDIPDFFTGLAYPITVTHSYTAGGHKMKLDVEGLAEKDFVLSRQGGRA